MSSVSSISRCFDCPLYVLFDNVGPTGQYENALNNLDLIFLEFTPNTIPRHEQEADPIFQKAHFRKARCLFELGSAVLALDSLNAYRDLVKGKVDDMEPPLREKIILHIAEAKKSVESDQNIRPVRYEIYLDGRDEPFIKHSTVPSDLCHRIPPRDRGIAFIVGLTSAHEASILNSQPGGYECWNCGKPATSLAHTPRLHLELPPEEGGPLVLDYVHPICTRYSECDTLAAKKMDGSSFGSRSREVLSMDNYAVYSAINGYGPPL